MYSPAITDFTLMVDKTSYMFVTGPDVIRTVTGEEVTKEALGGATTHNEISGVAHFSGEDDAECLAMVRELLSFLPANNLEDPPRRVPSDPADRADAILDSMVPAESNQPYDMKRCDHAHCGRWILLRSARALRAKHRRGICADEWQAGGNCGESTGVSCGQAEH